MNYRLLSWVMACCLGLPGAVYAQPASSLSPGATQQRSQDTLEFYKLDKLLDESRKEAPRVEQPPVVPEGAEERPVKASFLLSRVVTNPSRILSEEAIRKVAAPYEGREVSIDDLFRLLDELNGLYAERKIVTARAFLLPQKISDGVVEIRLVESLLGRVQIEGNKDTRSSYIADRFTLPRGELLTLTRLEQELQRFNRLNDIAVRAELRRGEEPLTTDCILKIIEPSPYALLVYADNAGQKDTGRERGGVLFSVRSLTGRRDVLSLGGNGSEGTRAGYLSYETPVHPSGTRMGLSYNINTIKVVDGVFEPLKITGESSDLDLYLSQPLHVAEDALLKGDAGFHWKKSTTDFDDVELFATKVRSAYAGLVYQQADASSVFYGRGEVTVGFDDFGGDRSFVRGNVDLAYRRQFAGGFGMLLRGSGQLADVHLLPSMEQFQLGGIATVRGYSEGLKLGDDGYFASLELYAPAPAWTVGGKRLNEMVKGVAFVDHGGAFPYKGDGESIDHKDFLTSVGGGVIFQLSQYLSGRLYIGFPLGEREENQDEARVHFFVQSNLL